MPSTPRNLAWLRGLKIDGVPDFGSRMSELVNDLVSSHNQLAQQTNANLDGHVTPPPPLQGVTATPTSTGIHVSIQHDGEFYRGTEYHGEYADNPHFTNPFPFSMGPTREYDLPIGPRTVYVRTFAQYQNGSPTNPVYHGGISPVSVTGGTHLPLGTSQGSGTGRPGQGLQGYGSTNFRSATGKPPTRTS